MIFEDGPFKRTPPAIASMTPDPSILLTIDVEDWFQVENFKPYIPFSSWPERELRVERNAHRLMDLFDSCSNVHGQQATDNGHPKKVRATFFVLGWLAERLPRLVREIHRRGHEVASHGYHHQLPGQLSARDFKQDLTASKKRLEDLVGAPVTGYRAPSFDVSDDMLKMIEDSGYTYDSSYNSFALHGRYGTISLNGNTKVGIAHRISENFFELPVSNLTVSFDDLKFQIPNSKFPLILPWGGGGYFRLIPGPLFQRGVKNLLAKQGAYLFYLHPWEVDPGQPRVESASIGSRLKHYTNLARTASKLAKMINNFAHCRFLTCSDYLALVRQD